MSRIAAREHITVNQLAAVNSLSNPDKIQAGGKLIIPAHSRLRSGWVSVKVERLTFELDGAGRTRVAEGTLGTMNNGRSKRLQVEAGKPDRRETDDGGHFIAPRFGGPKAAYNHFAQDANFNRGAFRAIEDSWADAQRRGGDVRVRIDVEHAGDSRRPEGIVVQWEMDGRRGRQKFKNEAGGGRE